MRDLVGNSTRPDGQKKRPRFFETDLNSFGSVAAASSQKQDRAGRKHTNSREISAAASRLPRVPRLSKSLAKVVDWEPKKSRKTSRFVSAAAVPVPCRKTWSSLNSYVFSSCFSLAPRTRWNPPFATPQKQTETTAQPRLGTPLPHARRVPPSAGRASGVGRGGEAGKGRDTTDESSKTPGGKSFFSGQEREKGCSLLIRGGDAPGPVAEGDHSSVLGPPARSLRPKPPPTKCLKTGLPSYAKPTLEQAVPQRARCAPPPFLSVP